MRFLFLKFRNSISISLQKSIIFISEMKVNAQKHRKKQKFTNKLRAIQKYSPPHRFTSYSAEDSHQNWRCQYSPERRIFQQLTQIKPFQIINKQKLIDAKINQIVAIHKKSNEFFFLYSQKFEGKKDKNLKLRCLQIIKNLTPRYIRMNDRLKNPHTIKDTKSILQKYDDIENQIASQLINQSKRQKNIFKATLSRLNNLIEQAETQFVRRIGQDISLDDLRQNGLRTFDKKERVCTQYSESIDQKIIESFPPKKRKVILDKNDFYTYLKASNKMINIKKIEYNRDQMLFTLYGLTKIYQIIKNTFFTNATLRKNFKEKQS